MFDFCLRPNVHKVKPKTMLDLFLHLLIFVLKHFFNKTVNLVQASYKDFVLFLTHVKVEAYNTNSFNINS
jgi:hypothetical protein